MAVRGTLERGYLSGLIASAKQTPSGLVDMRGFDWSAASELRPRYHEDRIVGVDFSKSRAERGFVVIDTVFEDCVFDESMWWLTVFPKCRFIRCSFDDCRLYTCSLGGKFSDCSFRRLLGKGEHFSFGWGSKYMNCVFESVHLRNIDEQLGVRFEDCKISGTFTKGVFHGRRYALDLRFSSVTDIFSTRFWPVKFIRCDLSDLTTEDVVFDKDVVFKNCKLSDQLYHQLGR